MKNMYRFVRKISKLSFFNVLIIFTMLMNSTQLESQSFKPELTVGNQVLTSYDVMQKRKFLTIGRN